MEVGDELRDFSVKELLDGIDLPVAPRAASVSMKAGARAIPVFIGYSHKDVVFLDQLRGALVPYERTGDLQVWRTRSSSRATNGKRASTRTSTA